MNSESLFRAIAAGLLIAAFATSSYFRNKADREGGQMRSPEGRGFVVVMRSFAAIILLPLVGYLIHPAWVTWTRLPVPEWARWIAVAVAAIAVPVLVWVLISLGTNISPTQSTREGHQLVTRGPYRWVRHPLYTAGLIFAAALTVVTALWPLGIGLIAGAAALMRRTPIEEARLIETFGDEYREYMKRTGRFLPRLSVAR